MLTRELIEQRRQVWHTQTFEGSGGRELDDMLCDAAIAGLGAQGEVRVIADPRLLSENIHFQTENARLTAELVAVKDALFEEQSKDVNRQTAIESVLGEIDRLKAEDMRLLKLL